MKNVLGGLLAIFVMHSLAFAQPQPPSQDELKQKRDAKLKEAFVTKAPWITDYDKAREESKKSSKFIFAYFTRSYAP
jgi:hypothetical protein